MTTTISVVKCALVSVRKSSQNIRQLRREKNRREAKGREDEDRRGGKACN